MILNRIGAQFHYDGVTYTIGAKVVANDASEYEGLYGTITEIRDGDDRETENDTPDIYCQFMPPVLPDDIRNMEARFSELYRTEKHLDELGLDMVIMAPEMLRVLEPAADSPKLTMFIVREDWAFNGDYGEDFHLATDPDMAKFLFTSLIAEEQESGYVKEWSDRPDMDLECKDDSYECWLHDSYCENHYKVYIEQKQLTIGADIFAVIGKSYVDSQLRKQFAEQIECWEELEDMTEKQVAQLIESSEVPQRIRKQLEQNGYLAESYWESVSEASFALVKNFKEGLR